MQLGVASIRSSTIVSSNFFVPPLGQGYGRIESLVESGVRGSFKSLELWRIWPFAGGSVW